MEGLNRSRNDLIRSMGRLSTNFKKIGVQNHTGKKIENRLDILEGYWKEFRDVQREISKCHSSDDSNYETAQDNAEEAYAAAKDYFQDLLQVYRPEDSSATDIHSPLQANVSECMNNYTALPRLPLPTYSGNLREWESFRDRFMTAVGSRPDLAPVTKLQYLQSCLTGAAAACLASVPITDSNYEIAWRLLATRFEDRKLVLHSHLNSLLRMPRASTGTVTELMVIRDTVAASLAALKAHERTVGGHFKPVA